MNQTQKRSVNNSMSKWLRARFHANEEDSRPVKFPPPGPFWETSTVGGYATVVAYVRNLSEVTEYWPEASSIQFEEGDEILFTERFPKPDWWSL
jgi:hypothetical protein